VKKIPGAGEFLAERDFDVERVSGMTGIEAETIRRAADIIREAERIVFIHSPDRPQDQAPYDSETIANFVVLLRAAGKRADLLLPRNIANSAGLEVVGADPAFAPGRTPVPAGCGGAASHGELRSMLENGEIRGAIVIGEDPVAWNRTGSWFQNIEFLAAIDWTGTETTRFADVVLPGSTYLETAGTRCNFEGKLVTFARAVEPPAGISGREILFGLASEFGIDVDDDTTAEIRSLVGEKLGARAAFYWNTGQERPDGEKMRLVATGTAPRTGTIPPPLTHGERYKREIREVGTERFRVRY
jgi:predicted molibdopterin-dependent oxidoreductase YjgC